MRKLTLLFTLLFTALFLMAQGPGAGGNILVTGIVVDDLSGEGLEYATVSLSKTADSSIVAGGITDGKGKFSLEAPLKGNYFLTISFIGYLDKTIPNISAGATDQAITLGNIRISADNEKLDMVEVTAEKSTISMQLDKRVFTVGKDLTSAGTNGSEVLENIPSVEVDVDGNVSLRGSGNVRILIDGKPSGLVGTSSADALRYLQADQIERVEIITNPSARYDAEGDAGIINIILKKDKKQGLNGSVTANVGYPQNYGGGFNLNYRTKHVNLFGGASINYRERPGSGLYYQENFNNDSLPAYETERDHNRRDFGQTVRLGTEFYWNNFNTLTLSGSFRYGDGRNTTDLLYKDLDANSNVSSATERDEDEDEIDRNWETEIRYDRTFKKKDQTFSASAKWILEEDREFGDIIQSTASEPTIFQRTRNTEDEKNYLLQFDYVHPFGNGFRFETGSRNTLRTIINKYSVEEQDDYNEWQFLPGFNDDFNYQENVYAGYVILGAQHGKFSWQAGLRTEFTDISITSRVQDANVKKDYLDWFPSAHLSYELNEENTVQVSYSRRLSRPNFRSLLPFSSFSDARNFRGGNPDLDPEYTHSIEVGYLKYWASGSFLTSVYFRRNNNNIERINFQLDEETNISIPINLSTQQNTGLEVTLTQDLFKWWNINAGINFYYQTTDGEYEGQDLSAETFSAAGRVNSKWKLPKGINVQASVRYISPRNTPQGKSKSMTMMDLAASVDLWKGKGVLSLNVRDVFNTRRWRSEVLTDDFFRETEFQWASRQTTLSFTYYFGQQKKRRGGGGDYDGGGMDDF